MRKLILLLSLCAFWACNTSSKAELEKINSELMKLHDEVMPKTMRLSEVKKKVLENPTEKAQEISSKIQHAEDEMYRWMEDYGKVLNEEKDEIKKLKKYKELLKTVEKIKKDTEKAISEASSLPTK